MKRTIALILLLSVAACTESGPDPSTTGPAFDAPIAANPLAGPQVIPGQWIVSFRPGVADPPGLARRLVAEAGGTLRHTYEHTIPGFSASLPAGAVEALGNNPNVERIEPNLEVHLVTEEAAASWGLDRVDQRALPLSGTYVYEADGGGVNAYVIDTGVRTSHQEFGGRAWAGNEADFVMGDPRGGQDCHGHGTHVAGTIAGTTYGVAKAANVFSVRVLGCDGSGSLDGVIDGIDWVTADHASRPGLSVANMSLAAWDPFGFYTTLNDHVAASVAAGVVYAVAASNDNDDACDYIPASEPSALTVGATASNDARASFSNWGSCLDLFAPGVGITSAYYSSDTATRTWSGTSMAAPHVAGVAALVLGNDPGATVASVHAAILNNTTDGVVGNPGPGSPDKLLYSLVAGEPPPPPTEVPADPTGLTATPMSDARIDLSWTHDGAGVGTFEVERSSDGVSWSPHATVGSSVTSYSDTGLGPDETWHYRVRGVNVVGPSGWSGAASATTFAEPPPVEDPGMEVWEISDVDVVQEGKFQYGSVGVTVMDANSDPALPTLLPGVTVQGDWYRDGDTQPVRSSTGVTTSFGIAVIESGRVKNDAGSGLYFCVTGLSAPGYQDVTVYPRCSDGFTPPDPGDPGDPGEPGAAPSNLTATWVSKGGGRVELSWTSGGSSDVDIFRNGALHVTTSDNGRYNDRGGRLDDVYQVCVAGDPTRCSNEAMPSG